MRDERDGRDALVYLVGEARNGAPHRRLCSHVTTGKLGTMCVSLGWSAILVRKEIVAMKEQLTAVFQQVPEGYVGFVEELPGANTQGDTLEEARSNLQEAVQLVLESNRALAEETLRNKVVIREPLASIS